jgi:lon-related putative ATP-dependent protease
LAIPTPLPASQLVWEPDPSELGFTSTEELEPATEPPGQERAVEALTYGLAIDRLDHNVFVLGPAGLGRHDLVLAAVRARAALRPVPSDQVYVANFADLRRPRALSLPAGRGRQLRSDILQLLGDLVDALINAFESQEYRTRRQVIEKALEERQEEAIRRVEEEAQRRGVALLRSPVGIAFAPMAHGRILPPEQFQALPEPVRHQIEANIQDLQEMLQQALQDMPAWIRDTRARIRRLNDETAGFVVRYLIAGLRQRWADVPQVDAFLDELQEDVVRHAEIFLQIPKELKPSVVGIEEGHPFFRRYAVNLLVDHSADTHAPVIYEDEPSFERLVGRIEHRVEMGALVTDFLMIRAGTLHRANGGYLVLDAEKLLLTPFAWEALKRALFRGEIRIHSPLEGMGLAVTVTLEPEPVPLALKVVLIGDRRLYYLLAELDPEFPRLFRVAAELDDEIERSPANLRAAAHRIAGLARQEGLRPLDATAVARILQHAARLAGDREKLSAAQRDLGDLAREADYHAAREGAERIAARHVEAALAARERRLSRLRERYLEAIRRDILHVATSGAVVGQINGLSVIELGGFAFGRPNRITARVRMGAGRVIDIEREVRLGGPIHSKGVLILCGYLMANYVPELPLSLAASLVFEQSYGGVDGDSASAAELLALLSAIAEVPLAQSLAITGSVDQHGRIQAIGGVNEKIEGFFDLCAARGLDGSHGVVVPASNRPHIMLARRVREAVADGRFRIWAVERIDEAIALFTGMEAGERASDGAWPEGSFHRRVDDRLRLFAHQRQRFAAEEPKTGDGGEEQ